MDIKIGADPELFVKHKGSVVSAYGMVPGTKDIPHPVRDGAVQVDGMALEFNIEPANSYEEFDSRVLSVLNTLSTMVPMDHELFINPVAEFTPKYMATQPKEATKLGCDPDFNAWNERANDPPNGDVPFRTAAGHIHIGWCEGVDVTDPIHFQDCVNIVRQLDYYLGVPSILMDHNTKRRELYGKAGAFRPKPYGVEYRVLSNFWLTSKDRIRFVYNQTTTCISNLLADKPGLTDQWGNLAEEIINTSDVMAANILCDRHEWRIPA